MSQFENIDNELLVAAPKTNKLFLVLVLAGLLSFLATIGLFTYTVVHNREISRDICSSSNENRKAVATLITQGQEEQAIVGELRDPTKPFTPGTKVVFYVPENPNKERTAEALAVVKPIDCEKESGGGL